jgi:hypothetical protein
MKRLLVPTVLAFAPTLISAGFVSADPSPQSTWKEKRQERHAAGQTYPDVEEWRQAWHELSPADQATLAQAWSDVADAARNLTPTQKRNIRDAGQRAAARLKSLNPAQKAQLKVELQRANRAYLALTADQKAALLAQMANTIERLQSVSPAQKETLKSLYRRLFGL